MVETADCEYALRSGFWADREVDPYDVLVKSEMQEDENYMEGRHVFFKTYFTEDDELQALEEIMEALELKQIDFRYLNSENSVEELITDWAKEIWRGKKEKSISATIDVANKNCDLIDSGDDVEDDYISTTVKMIQRFVGEENITSNIPVGHKNIIQQAIKTPTCDSFNSAIPNCSINEELEKYYSMIKKEETDRSDENSENSLFIFKGKEYFKKYDLSPCFDDDQPHFEVFPLADVTMINSKGQTINIPNWEIDEIFEKYWNKENEETKKKVTPKAFKADNFDNLQAQLAKEHQKKIMKEQIKKADRTTRIKMKQT